jgi:hypothetical protein
MRVALRSFWITLLALLGAILLGLSSTIATVLQLAVTTALIMGGTFHPLSVPPDTQPFVNGYVAGAENNYIVPGGFCPLSGCTPVAVITPEQFFPVFGTMTFDQSVAQGVANLNQCVQGSASCVTNQAVPGTTAPPYGAPFVIFGFSQSATVATVEKRNLAAEPSPPTVGFVLIANPNRPNGGILERFQGLSIPFLGVTFNGATPTNTPFMTIDVARQYDAISDFPNNPLNLLADLNAGAGYFYLHGATPNFTLGDAVFQDQVGDTSYYLIPTNRLPLLMPLAQLGVPDPILAVLDAPLRVLVEAGYNRTISPGQPTTANFFYFPTPIALVVNLAVSIPTGLDNGLSEVGLGRPFGTQPPGPYGVGGPPVTLPSAPPTTTLVSGTSPTTPQVFASTASTGPPTTNTNTSTANSDPPPSNTNTSPTKTTTLSTNMNTNTSPTNTNTPPTNTNTPPTKTSTPPTNTNTPPTNTNKPTTPITTGGNTATTTGTTNGSSSSTSTGSSSSSSGSSRSSSGRSSGHPAG